MQKFDRIYSLSISIYELNFYQEDSKWKHNLTPIEISKNDTVDRVIDIIINKNLYVLKKKLNVFIGKEDKKYDCGR